MELRFLEACSLYTLLTLSRWQCEKRAV